MIVGAKNQEERRQEWWAVGREPRSKLDRLTGALR